MVVLFVNGVCGKLSRVVQVQTARGFGQVVKVAGLPAGLLTWDFLVCAHAPSQSFRLECTMLSAAKKSGCAGDCFDRRRMSCDGEVEVTRSVMPDRGKF